MICNHIIDKGRHKTKSSQSHVRRLSLVYINIIDKGRNKKMHGGVKGGGVVLRSFAFTETQLKVILVRHLLLALLIRKVLNKEYRLY
jgi:hypothetical protein